MENSYDIIIIGAGIAGLYSALNIKKLFPKMSYLILESNKKEDIGGRIGKRLFYNTPVNIGAGIGRVYTDKLLLELLDELNIHYGEFKININYSASIQNNIDVNKIFNKLKDIYNNLKNKPSITFREFGLEHLGEKIYKDFITCSGYSDYELEDIYEVLYYYEFNNNSSGWTGFGVDWTGLIKKLCKKIGINNIKTSSKVKFIHKLKSSDNLFEIITDKNRVFYSNKIIVATNINTTQKLFPYQSIYKEIHGQQFLYVYAKFDKTSSEIMAKYVPYYTIVSGPLQKMIPINTEKGIYMIAYADNKNASYLKTYSMESTIKNKKFFEKQVEKALDISKNTLHIIAIKQFYWTIGTHYYEPLNFNKYKNREEFISIAQNPDPNILVVGEQVSRKQGWSEGALESVRTVLNKKWLEK
jgi:hypothetical protein